MCSKLGKDRGMVTSVNKDSSSAVLRRFDTFSFLGTFDILYSVLQHLPYNQSRLTCTDSQQLQNNYDVYITVRVGKNAYNTFVVIFIVQSNDADKEAEVKLLASLRHVTIYLDCLFNQWYSAFNG